MKTVSTLMLFLLSLVAVVGKHLQVYQVQENLHRLKSPIVQAYDCTECVWNDQLNYLCMDHSVDLQVGWEFTQSYSIFTGSTIYYWKLRFFPYGLFSITLHPSFKVDRLYALELTGNVDEIKSYVFAEFLYFVDRTVCFNFGWYTTKILMTLKIAMSFKDCYKNIWYTLLDYNNWYGPTALWID